MKNNSPFLFLLAETAWPYNIRGKKSASVQNLWTFHPRETLPVNGSPTI